MVNLSSSWIYSTSFSVPATCAILAYREKTENIIIVKFYILFHCHFFPAQICYHALHVFLSYSIPPFFEPLSSEAWQEGHSIGVKKPRSLGDCIDTGRSSSKSSQSSQFRDKIGDDLFGQSTRNEMKHVRFNRVPQVLFFPWDKSDPAVLGIKFEVLKKKKVFAEPGKQPRSRIRTRSSLQS